MDIRLYGWVQQEQKIGDLLLGAKIQKFDMDGKMEIQKIIGVIHQKPCRVSLNGYIVLEKRMILTVRYSPRKLPSK